MRAQSLLGPGRHFEPGHGHVARAQLARVHEDVGAKAVPLLHRSFVEAPDEHGALCTRSGAAAGKRRLTNDQVDQLAGTTTSLTTSLPSRCLATFSLSRARRSSSSRGVGACLDPVAQLAVDLDDQGHRVAGQQRRIGLRPGLLPDPLAFQPLPDLGAQVGGEGKDQRGGGGGGEAHRRAPAGSP